jgi:type IV secretory pathway TrbD component
MTHTPPIHPVQKSINRPLTIWGAERRLFFVALVMGATTFNFFGSLLGGVLMFAALFAFARWATIVDPEILRIVLNSAKFAAYFDPLKRAPHLQGGEP